MGRHRPVELGSPFVRQPDINPQSRTVNPHLPSTTATDRSELAGLPLLHAVLTESMHTTGFALAVNDAKDIVEIGTSKIFARYPELKRSDIAPHPMHWIIGIELHEQDFGARQIRRVLLDHPRRAKQLMTDKCTAMVAQRFVAPAEEFNNTGWNVPASVPSFPRHLRNSLT